MMSFELFGLLNFKNFDIIYKFLFFFSPEICYG